MSQEESSKDKELLPSSTKTENALDIAGVITSVVPWIGSPVSAVLSGMSIGRKFDRVRKVLDGLADDLKGFKSEVSEKYVRTEEFEELLEKTLLKAADERNDEKRQVYRAFLRHEIQSPGKPYEEQMRCLKTLEVIQPDHILVLRAMGEKPDNQDGFSGSHLATLRTRLPNISDDRISLLVAELNEMRLSNLTSLKTMMTYRGAQDMRHAITPYGKTFVEFLVAE
jgi:hypothetical protein